MFFDAHIHIKDLAEKSSLPFSCFCKQNYFFASSAHSKDEFEFAEETKKSGWNILLGFGIHPWNLEKNSISYLEELISANRLDFIGEFGLDFYEKFKDSKELQTDFFKLQLEAAIKSGLPAVFHLRKSMAEFISYFNELKKLKAVILHSYSSSFEDAIFLLKKGVNTYFSFGTQLLNNNKKAENSFAKIPLTNILLETDAPYQPIKGFNITEFTQIEEVYKKAAEIKKVELEYISELIEKTWKNIFSRC